MNPSGPMTEERLKEIEARREEAVDRWARGDIRLAYDVVTDDMPALVAEVRMLRGVLGIVGSVFGTPSSARVLDAAVLAKTVEELDAVEDLGVRVLNACRRANIRTVADMARLTAKEWLAFRNFGRRSLRRVREALEGEGLHIGALARPEGA